MKRLPLLALVSLFCSCSPVLDPLADNGCWYTGNSKSEGSTTLYHKVGNVMIPTEIEKKSY